MTAAEVIELIPDGHKRCAGKCRQVKPLREFYLNPKTVSGKRSTQPSCRQCRVKDQEAKRTRSVERVAYKRARARAVAIVAERHAAEVDAVAKELLPLCIEEAKRLGPETKLKPGRKMSWESVADRIAELCQDCGKSHRHGHECGVCGSKPGEPANAVPLKDVLEGTELRFPGGKPLVIQP